MRVFISRKIPNAGIELLKESGCDLDIWPHSTPPTKDELIAHAKEADGVISMLSDKIDRFFFDNCPRLKVLSNYAVGINNIDIAYAFEKNILIGNTPDVLTESTADLAFALLIASARRLIEGYNNVKNGEWKNWEPLGFLGQELRGKTVGIIGMGRIGQAMARRCYHGFGMKILYNSRTVRPQIEKEYKTKMVDLDTLLKKSDFISIHANLTKENEGLFDKTTFKKMKKTAIFINTARGQMHNEDDLYLALKNGEIQAAGLDVTNPEPINKNSPLLSLPNVLILPHIGSASHETRDAMSILAAKNIISGLTGKPLPGLVQL